MKKKVAKNKELCLHELTKLVGEMHCDSYPYCCEGMGDGHDCYREHSFQLFELCTDCGKELNKGVEVKDLDTFVNAIVESCS